MRAFQVTKKLGPHYTLCALYFYNATFQLFSMHFFEKPLESRVFSD